jgi:hypothetical protein
MDDGLTLCRQRIQSMKKVLLTDSVFTTQDPSILNDVKKRMSELYSLLLPIVRGEKNVATLPPGVRELFGPCFVLSGGGEEPSTNLFEYYLHRDLIMFPFVFDLERIDTVRDLNTLEKVSF